MQYSDKLDITALQAARRKLKRPPTGPGRRLGLSLPRRFVGDLLSFAKRVPTVPMERRMELADVVVARRASDRRISWCAIFLKAYAIVAAKRPELRRAYISFPWPTIYEHPVSVATFSLEREYRGEDGVFFAQVPQPEIFSLTELDALVRYYKLARIDRVSSFRKQLLVSRLPRPLRRLLWWFGLCTNGHLRATHFGTFGISVVASFGAAGLHLLSPLTTTLNYGSFQPDGSIDVRLTYDHRALDGAPVARALAELEDVLHGEILFEMRELPPREEFPDREHLLTSAGGCVQESAGCLHAADYAR